jgi:hypothetical protein
LVAAVAEPETGAAAEAATTPVLLKADIEAGELVIVKVVAEAEEVVAVHQEDGVESVDEDAAEASRTIHHRHHRTQLLQQPTLKVPLSSLFPCVPPKVAF